ncbi:MAG: anti-sigma factor antagonist [Candidatus Magnetobacterium sp. LHC-1]|uniref:Anti-sigma factor antagonist n=1 Tax=Candidatus Magnetobacterium casense TaxID=1455061 RepID=A0ABS6S4C5_9BACT|nr:anti-sigma factor antagonist [Candidatus Magnetobacterium casensis]MBF0606206.1 anti-sigma factor antagonist [Nitrospirota bacterium]MBV6343696.1 anti-sigma factor antagonist [Candidatus Magnetobacterium casensis]
MSLTVTSDVVEGIARITLVGEVDSGSVGKFKDEVDKVAKASPKEIVLCVKELSFMSSAGLRVIVFAKQKLGVSVPIYVVKPQEMIVDTLKKTGLLHSVSIVDEHNKCD